MRHQLLALNGVFDAGGIHDNTAVALARRQADALSALPAGLAGLPRVEVPLLGFAPIGPDALARVLDPTVPAPANDSESEIELAAAPLAELIEELESPAAG